MSQVHDIALIGSQYRIEPWTTILSDGGVSVTPPDQVVGISAALCLGTVMERPTTFGLWWVRKVPLEDALTAAHHGIGRLNGEEVSAAFHGAIHGLRLIGKAGEVSAHPDDAAAAVRRLLTTVRVPEPV
jgi:hypothetical protein